MTKKGKREVVNRGRPYTLSIADHRELIRRKERGDSASGLATFFQIGLHTVYAYLALDPEKRKDA